MVGLTGAAALAGTGSASASDRRKSAEPRVVSVPTTAFGAVVAAIGGGAIEVRHDPSLPVATMRIGQNEVTVAERLMLKGRGDARRRYLDDARNAPKLGASVRDRLRTQWPALGPELVERHKAWSRQLVRDVLRWTRQLSQTGLRGKRIRDPFGRVYLLEWAGATVDVSGDPNGSPAGLRDAPTGPDRAHPDAYRDYVQSLVDRLHRLQ